MERKELLWKFQETIIEIYNEFGINSLRGINAEYSLNGKQIIVWYHDVTRKSSCQNHEVFNYIKNFDDLLFCSDELLYFTAHLFLYKPFINDPLKDRFKFSGKMVYPNHQNMEAKRYNMFADITSQKAYNYWDRIGDLIASFFPKLIKPHQVFFSKAIEIIPAEFQKSENYLWLKRFKENEYVQLNKLRKQIVHYITSDTTYKHGHLNASKDIKEIIKLQNERELLPDFYKHHISLTLIGFDKTLSFLEEINPVLFKDE
jgi:hypothetical protein